MINHFDGEYRFLSNFYPCTVQVFGREFRNSEAAYQSQKTTHPGVMDMFCGLEAGAAKRLGQRIEMRPDWDVVKNGVMWAVLQAKFNQNPYLKQLLLNTGHEYLEEGNFWGDRYWGTVDGVGLNTLGSMLMQLRKSFMEEE